jgi:hypothetical protein
VDAKGLNLDDFMPAIDQVRTGDVETKTGPVSQPKVFLARLSFFSWSSFFFALLQSVCSAFIALHSIRFLVGVGAFAAATATLRLADRLHIDAIRIPMMLLALIGSLLNLIALWRARSLRKRTASAWRQKLLTPEKKRSERLQFGLSVLTLALLVTEFFAHRATFHGH